MPLVPAVIDAVEGKVPVVAAGGIADGRGLAAALMLGAEGAVVGTRLLSSHEAGIHEQYKHRIINAKETDTVYTDLFNKGWPDSHMRVLFNSTYEKWLAAGQPLPGNRPGEHDVITQYCQETPVERYSCNLPAPVMEGDLEPLAHYAGQSVGLVRSRKSAHEILDEIIEGAVNRLNACQRFII